MNQRISNRSLHLRRSPVRDILSFHGRSDMISFAGGLPSPSALPVEQIRLATDRVLTKHGTKSLQYGTTEGFPPLREWIADRLTLNGLPTGHDEILITSGSQQALDLIGRFLINPGDNVATEFPCYNGALQSFELQEAKVLSLYNEDGYSLNERLEDVKFVYLIPTLNNPSGKVMSTDERMRIASFLDENDLLLFEDDPYGDLMFHDSKPPHLASFMEKPFLLTGSFSKIVSPSLRMGWLRVPKDLLERMIPVKQAMDLHTNLFSQMILHSFLTDFSLEIHLQNIRDIYKTKQDIMRTALERSEIHIAPIQIPPGGMFLWIEFSEYVATTELAGIGLEEGVAFVPGSAFFPDPLMGKSMARLNYTCVEDTEIITGVERLKLALEKYSGLVKS